ncbi:gliding motility-associated C-terminal domain-containing protein [Pontibacter qinzhouensis]|uniref:Gliding motility-associated C-terminal domain-containing protein n=1 Tax=Pontibacter qinzhouensis TaxID=2603253 RepID=A0A5C8KF65_9BACT|nr:gliding motility-associated C-terminal domain-containing protein [Pontibacter qinzhouensis]TXK52197.1 gliding motility-associated C-terminal domain-containing protein [Pontibacter qinzhouensis]
MKKRLFLLIYLLVVALGASATHIVGGEFELRHLAAYNYRLTLNLYYDEVNGDPAAIDPVISVGIFEKASNRLMMTRQVSIRSRSNVPYTNIDCTVGQLKTGKVVYHDDIVLDPSLFTHPDGYYIVYERCCRNRTINNIINPEAAANTFYMEFPPVVRDRQAFRNSSPVLFPPLSDYACRNELFYFDFGGTDPDGDSLVYDMVTPLNGSSSQFNPAPPPSRAPHSTIMWQAGYSPASQILGSPPVNIDSRTGRLVVQPSAAGLYVFGVRCQEFRGGRKIGEVRRDFQLLVLNCTRNEPPKILATERGTKKYYNNGEVLQISPSSQRCIDIYFTDPDPNEPLEFFTRPVNFTDNSFTVEGNTSGMVNSGNGADTLTATLCFPLCYDTQGKIYELDFIVRDNGCSLPKLDTLRLRFLVEPLPDTPPSLSLSTPDRVFEVEDGGVIAFNVTGNDPDQDVISVTAAGVGFNLNSQKITFAPKTGVGPLTSAFNWELDCQAMKQKSYQIEFLVTSEKCGKQVVTKEVVEVRTRYDNSLPILSSDQTARVFEMELNQEMEANFLGEDIDLHGLVLEAVGVGFNLADYGMTFTAVNGNGNATGKFNMVANCEIFEQGAVRVDFNLREDACVVSPVQTIKLEFKVKVPDISEFLPSNIFTPNGDGKNDFFGMPTLPANVCTGSFQNITIFNRWGKEVYSSTEQDFRWDGKHVNAGVYYYVIDYRTNKFKGSVTLVR